MKLLLLALSVLVQLTSGRDPRPIAISDNKLQVTNNFVRVPINIIKGSNSLYASLFVGTPAQPIAPTVYTDTFAITVVGSAFKS